MSKSETDVTHQSCGCVFCDIGLKPIKLRRQMIHRESRFSPIVVCEAATLKPGRS